MSQISLRKVAWNACDPASGRARVPCNLSRRHLSHKVCVHVDLWTGKQKEGKSLAAEGRGAHDLEKVHHYDDDGDEPPSASQGSVALQIRAGANLNLWLHLQC